MFVISAVPLTKLVEVLYQPIFIRRSKQDFQVDIRKTVVLVSALVLLGTLLRLCRLVFPKNPTLFLIRFPSLLLRLLHKC